MLFICFWAFGCPEPTGIVTNISGFAIPAFFVLSGFYVLDTNREVRMEKVLRKIKRSALCFAFIFLFYVALNVGLMFLTHTVTITFSKRMVFEFVVMNLWPLPIGDNIWFIQAMLYAYIVIFILDKLKLLRFYRILLVILFVFMLLTGEFSGVIRFNVLGYPYIPGNWLTRALPYILLGKLLRDVKEKLIETKFWKYLIAFVIGGGFVILEIFLLTLTGTLRYPGHMIGFTIMAIAVCGLAISIPIGAGNRVVHFDSAISGFIYVFMNPICYALFFFLGASYPKFASILGGPAAYLASFLLALILCSTPLGRVLFTNWDQRLYGAVELDDEDY
jgi:hypothetical protein